jgi:hypothetical protein
MVYTSFDILNDSGSVEVLLIMYYVPQVFAILLRGDTDNDLLRESSLNSPAGDFERGIGVGEYPDVFGDIGMRFCLRIVPNLISCCVSRAILSLDIRLHKPPRHIAHSRI